MSAGALDHTGGLQQYLRCQARTPTQGAQHHHAGVQQLRGFLATSRKEPVASAEPQKVFQVLSQDTVAC